jgi:hypothetical protein
VLLIILLLLFVLFGGLGFALHLLWIGAVIFLVVAVFHAVTRGSRSS